LPLIEFIESDELFLQDEPQALWFDVLRKQPRNSSSGHGPVALRSGHPR
jgi:hypothetical protein